MKYQAAPATTAIKASPAKQPPILADNADNDALEERLLLTPLVLLS